MSLCISGKDSLAVLEVQANKYFSAILNKNASTIEDDFLDANLHRILPGRFDRLLPHITALHSLNRMKLVVPSSPAVAAAEEELKKKVAELGTIDPTGVLVLSPEASLKHELPSFDPSSIYPSSLLTSHCFLVSSARNQKSNLSFFFPIPPELPFSTTAVSSFLSSVVGNQSFGPLSSYLLRLGMLESEMAGPQQDYPSFSTFCLSLTLAEEGVRMIDKVVKILFLYIKTLRESMKKWHPEVKKCW